MRLSLFLCCIFGSDFWLTLVQERLDMHYGSSQHPHVWRQQAAKRHMKHQAINCQKACSVLSHLSSQIYCYSIIYSSGFCMPNWVVFICYPFSYTGTTHTSILTKCAHSKLSTSRVKPVYSCQLCDMLAACNINSCAH